ncbi:MAG: DUF4124 domain-containing protein [Desulfatitalea sp.]
MAKGIINSTMVVFLLLLLFAPVRVHSDIYSWVDEKGVRHFSNTHTDGAGDKADTSPEFSVSREEEERVEQGSARKAAREKGNDTDDSLRNKSDEEETQSRKNKTQQEKKQLKAREEIQAKCKNAKERLSTLRFTSLNKYENPEVEKYASEWSRHHHESRHPKENSNWRKERDEDIQKYKKFKYDQELKQAEKDVDDYCKN